MGELDDTLVFLDDRTTSSRIVNGVEKSSKPLHGKRLLCVQMNNNEQ